MITMFSYSLARKLKETNISSILVQPGFVSTNLGKNSGSSILSGSFSIMRPFQISAREAAKTPVYLAAHATGKEFNGKCFSRLKEIKTSGVSYDVDLQEKLWIMTSNALGLPVDLA
jgi:NAD(P)-dependent dehydrogenase (short-subunit alcohol dehydrogenase family)